MSQTQATPRHGDRVGREQGTRFGGVFATEAALKALGAKKRTDDQIFYTADTDRFWRFDAASAATASNNVLAPDAGTGRFLAAFARSQVHVASKAIGIADLTASAMSQAIDFDAALPADAVFMGAYGHFTAAFTNGMGSATTFSLGLDTIDPDGFVAVGDADGGAGRVGTPLGVMHGGAFIGGATPEVTIASDVNVDTLTGGAATFYVLYLTPEL